MACLPRHNALHLPFSILMSVTTLIVVLTASLTHWDLSKMAAIFIVIIRIMRMGRLLHTICIVRPEQNGWHFEDILDTMWCGQFSPKSSQNSLPVRTRYGMHFVGSNSYSYSISVTAMMYTISCYIGPHYNSTRLYLFQTCNLIKMSLKCVLNFLIDLKSKML